ncbi:MAG: iron chelate uptake ABC transporter family permease subunit [bacterium]
MSQQNINYANLGDFGNQNFSLLYPSEAEKKEISFRMPKQVIDDLNLDGIIDFMQSSEKSIGIIKEIIYNPLTDINAIKYRQSIIEDLVNNSAIVESFKEIISNIEVLEKYNQQNITSEAIKKHGPYEIKNKLMQIEHYFQCIEKLSEGFENANQDVSSEGLKKLNDVVEKVKKRLIVSATLVTASVVAVSGSIGFIGLIVPHISRMLIGPDNRKLFPLAFFIGGIFLLISDNIARTLLAPLEIPVGIITALAGGPYFIYLLRKKKNEIW